jgi:hypothetical protein
MAGKVIYMKKNNLIIAAAIFGFGTLIGCSNSSDRNSASGEEGTEQSDSTYLDSQDNNGQPTTDDDKGGTVTETEGAPESGYGQGNGTELQPSDEKADDNQ